MRMKLHFRGHKTPSIRSLRIHFPMCSVCEFSFYILFRHTWKKVRGRRSHGKKTDDSGPGFERLIGQLWHVRCSYSACADLFLDLCTKKNIGNILPCTPCIGFICSFVQTLQWRDMTRMTRTLDRNTCCLNVWVIVMSWAMTEGVYAAASGTLLLSAQTHLEIPTERRMFFDFIKANLIVHNSFAYFKVLLMHRIHVFTEVIGRCYPSSGHGRLAAHPVEYRNICNTYSNRPML